MRKKKANLLAIVALALFGLSAAWAAAPAASDLPEGLTGLAGPFDLAAPRKAAVREYVQETRLVHMNMKGQRTGTETLTLKLRCVPSELRGKPGDEYTCLEFIMSKKNGETVTIPALAGLDLRLLNNDTDLDDKGQVFGIPHARFDGPRGQQGRRARRRARLLRLQQLHRFPRLRRRLRPSDARGARGSRT